MEEVKIKHDKPFYEWSGEEISLHIELEKKIIVEILNMFADSKLPMWGINEILKALPIALENNHSIAPPEGQAMEWANCALQGYHDR